MPLDPIVHIIDDDDDVRDALSALLQTEGMEVESYASAEAFLAHPPPPPGGCIVTDVQMAKMSGLDLLRRLGEAEGGLPVIVMTGRVQAAMADEAMRSGAYAFIEKPFTPDAIIAAVRRAVAGPQPSGRSSRSSAPARTGSGPAS